MGGHLKEKRTREVGSKARKAGKGGWGARGGGPGAKAALTASLTSHSRYPAPPWWLLPLLLPAATTSTIAGICLCRPVSYHYWASGWDASQPSWGKGCSRQRLGQPHASQPVLKSLRPQSHSTQCWQAACPHTMPPDPSSALFIDKGSRRHGWLTPSFLLFIFT